ncbi:MAG: sulfatase [Novipirellula sp. JB048]
MITIAAKSTPGLFVTLAAAGLLAGLLICTPVQAEHGERPNIILCMADDQGWGDTGYNGHPLLKTPHLDAMAAEGLRLDRFYAAAPVCTPTRASVLTGRHPNRSGAFSWGLPLRPQEITLAERLQAAGYVTGHFGKWHLGSVLKGSPVNPTAAGFDHWLSAYNFYDNDPLLSREGTAVALQGESSIVTAEAAIEFIKEQKAKGKPFLAVVWFCSPHVPHRAAVEDRKLYEGHKKADWLGEITGLDRAVGKLQAALREEGIRDNTLFWYTSDNGGLETASSGGRNRKGSIYEGGLRVPAIIQWPSRITTPRVTQAIANTSDIYPTLMEIVGIETDPQPVLDGVSLLSVIDDESDERAKPMGFWSFNARGILTPSDAWMRELLAAQQAGKEDRDESRLMLDAGEIKQQYAADYFVGHAAWHDWPWKLHRISKPTKKNQAQTAGEITTELYNLVRDPMETQNLASQHPERVAAMRDQLEAWQASVIQSLNGHDYAE